MSPGLPPPPPEVEEEANDFQQVRNPLAEMKKVAIRAEALRVARAGDGVDVPAGWSVQRYAPKVAGLTADDLMKADPRGRPNLSANLWWGLPKDAAAAAVVKHGGAHAVAAATREGRRLSLPA